MHHKKFYGKTFMRTLPFHHPSTNTMNPANFDGTSERFLNWFKSLENATFSDAIKIVDLRDRNAGRGISKSLSRV